MPLPCPALPCLAFSRWRNNNRIHPVCLTSTAAPSNLFLCLPASQMRDYPPRPHTHSYYNLLPSSSLASQELPHPHHGDHLAQRACPPGRCTPSTRTGIANEPRPLSRFRLLHLYVPHGHRRAHPTSHSLSHDPSKARRHLPRRLGHLRRRAERHGSARGRSRSWEA